MQSDKNRHCQLLASISRSVVQLRGMAVEKKYKNHGPRNTLN